MHNLFGYNDSAVEAALYEPALLQEFARPWPVRTIVPDESTESDFHCRLESQDVAPTMLSSIITELSNMGLLLRQDAMVDAKIIHDLPSNKNKGRERDADLHQTTKGRQWYFGMNARHQPREAFAGTWPKLGTGWPPRTLRHDLDELRPATGHIKAQVSIMPLVTSTQRDLRGLA
jgi:IS5 family transposase